MTSSSYHSPSSRASLSRPGLRALDRLSKKGIVELDEERKAAMVSNLLVVLCSDRAAQPMVNGAGLRTVAQ